MIKAMQKKLMMIVILLLALSNRMAADDQVDQLTISDFSIFTEQTKDVSIALTNADAYAGFQFDLELPEGVTVSAYSANSARITTAAELSMQQQTDGTYRFVFLSQSATPLSGNSGDAIINLTLQAAATVAVGEKTGYFKNIKLSKADGTGPTYTSQSFTFTVRGDEPYAVLSDEATKLTFYYDKLKDDASRTSANGIFELSDQGWLYYSYKLTVSSVVFDDSFANFTDLTTTAGWFEDYSRLTTIVGLGNLKTVNVTDMSSMFKGCNELTSLDFSGFNTAKVTDMSNMFSGCSKLTSLNLSSFNTAAVIDMNNMFHYCSELTSLIVTNFNTSNVKDMSSMFAGCSKLTELDVHNFNTVKVENMAGMFSSCSNMTGIDVSDFNTASVKDMSGMFYGCSILESLDLGSFNTTNVTSMQQMFDGCKAITMLDLGSFDTHIVENMKWMFNNCNSLKTIYVGNNWSTVAVESDGGWYVFTDCTSLAGGSGTNYSSLYTAVEYAHIDDGTSNPGYFTDVKYKGKSDEPYAALSDNNTTLTFYYDKDKDFRTGAVSIDLGWESNKSTISSVVFDDSFANYSELTSTANWFQECRSLSSITGIGNLKTDNVTDMSAMFDACESLTSLDVSGFVTDNVTDMKQMFIATGLTSLDLSSFNTSKVKNMSEMFRECRSLTTLTFDKNKFKTDEVTTMWLMFKDCENLTSLDVSHFGTGKVTTMEGMFSGCAGITTLDVSTFNTESVLSMNSMFNGCSALTSLDLSSFNTESVTDMALMFCDCTSLQTISISSSGKWSVAGVSTGINTGADMFMNCTSLVGGSNTAYDSSHIDYLYARVDEPFNNQPGYFTDIIPTEAYAVISNSNATLTFYFDKEKNSRTGVVGMDIGWESYKDYITTVVFDDSFARYDGVTTTKNWFMSCTKLESISGLINLNTSNVTDMTGMFQYCEKLTSLDLSSWNTASVEKMTNLFYNCKLLESLTLSSFFTTANVIGMGSMFYGCEKLSSLDLSCFNTEKVTLMEEMFYGCTSLTELDLSTFNTANVTDMNDMFYGDTNLKTIYVGSGWQTSVTSPRMFQGCTSLVGGDGTKYASYDISEVLARIDKPLVGQPGYFTDIADKGVARPYAVFDADNSTLTFYYDENQPLRGGMTVGPFESDDYKGWVSNGDNITTVVFDDSFANCTTLTSTAYWFSGCYNLTSITGLANLKTENVTDMSNMFTGVGITSLNFSSFNTSKVKNMSSMFYSCTNLATLDVSNFNTEAVTNMSSMFYGCSNLNMLDLSSFKTDKVTNMSNMFYGNTGLKKIYVSDKWSTVGVSDGQGVSTDMFISCSSLVGENGTTYDDTHINYLYARIDNLSNNEPGYFTNVTEFGKEPYAVLSDDNKTLTFYYNQDKIANNGMNVGPFSAYFDIPWYEDRLSITTVKFDNSFANYAGLTSTKWMLGDLANLESVVGIENLKTDNVTDMSSMFMGSGMSSLDLSSFNTANVTDMSSMFEMCLNLTSLNLSNFNTAKVKNMSNMFYRCETLESLNLESFVTSSLTDMGDMFHDCKILTSLDLSSFNTGQVTRMGQLFWGDEKLVTIYVGNGWSTAGLTGSSEESMFKVCSALVGENGTTYDADHEDYTYAHIDGGTSNPGYLTNVIYKDKTDEPYAVLSDNNTTLTFYYDKKKETRGGMDVGPFSGKTSRGWHGATADITKIVFDSSFANCTSITSTAYWFAAFLTNPTFEGMEYFNTENVTDMTEMFSGSKSLSNLDLSSLNTSSVTNMSLMFYECNALETLNLTGWNTANVTDMSQMFRECTQLQSIDLGGFNTGSVTDMSSMFASCSTLTSLDVSNFNTSKVSTFNSMFYGCTNLTSINLSGFDTSNATVFAAMFAQCPNLTSLDLSDFNTRNALTVMNMFYSDTSLKEIFVGADWSLDKISETSDNGNPGSGDDFTYCYALVGGSGTTYSAEHTDYIYARIDGGPNSDTPGYLTDINSPSSFGVAISVVGNGKLTIGTTEINVDNPLEITVNRGDSITMIITPTSGNLFDNIKVDDVDVTEQVEIDATSKAMTYTFGGVYGEHSVVATFVNDTNEAYSVLTDNTDDVTTDAGTVAGKTLTFYYDKQKEARGGMDATAYWEWHRSNELITSVVFDDSFANCNTIESTASWFQGCKNLTSITGLDKLNTTNVTEMQQMFYECSSLTSLDLRSFNTANVNTMFAMFYGCSSLASVDVSSFNTESVEYLGNMFYNCSSLTSLNLSNFNTASAKNMGGMFSGCSNLTTIYVSQGWTTDLVVADEGLNMFNGCEKLVGGTGTVYDPNNYTYTYAHIDGGISNPGYLTDIDDITRENEPYAVLTDNTENVTTDAGVVVGKTLTFYYDKHMQARGGMSVGPFSYGSSRDWNTSCSSITTVVFDDSFANCTSLTSTANWFAECEKLEEIVDIGNLNTDNVQNMNRMFLGCSSLTQLDVSHFNTANVTDMGGMFAGCNKLEYLDVSRFNTANVIDIGNMFESCESLTSLDVSNFVTDNVTSMIGMFMGCYKLNSLDVSKFNTDNVKSIAYMFSACRELKTIDVSHFNTASVRFTDYMFSSCTGLETLDLSSFNTAGVESMKGMFSLCHNLKTIYVGNEWNTENVTGGNDMFKECTNLVGGNETVFDSNNISYTYAHIDGGTSNPGYFTDIAEKDLEVEPYAVLTDNTGGANTRAATVTTKTLTFYYDKRKAARNGMSVGPFELPQDRGWESVAQNITAVEFDASMANDTTITSTAYWFYGCQELRSITGMENLRTQSVTDMKYMFYGCNELEQVDVSGFNTAKATDMSGMFYKCHRLQELNLSSFNTFKVSNMSWMFYGCYDITKIYVASYWTTASVTESEEMFVNCTNLVGGAGTIYNESHVDATYAHLDDGVDNPGYFTNFTGVTLTAKDYSREYGDDNPTFEFTAKGVTISGTPTITCGATKSSPAGTYPITIAYTKVDGESELDITCVNGTLTITKAPLTITAKSYSIKQGKSLPTFEAEYSGFKNNETDAVLITKPSVSANASEYSEPGEYEISVSGAEADNYEISYVNGTLTITAKTETFDGIVLTVEDGGSIDDAFEYYGGRDEAAKTLASIVWNSSTPLTSEMLEGIDNPNLLVYVKEASMAPAGVNNVVVNGKAKSIVLVDADGNNNFYVPQEFTAEKISYTREFKQTTKKNVSRGWEGICLPFDVQTFTHESHGVIAPFGNSASNYHFWLHQFTEEGISDAETIEANKPYIISMPNSDEYSDEFNQAGIIQFASVNVTVPVTETMSVMIGDTLFVIPTFQEVKAFNHVYALNIGEDVDNYVEGSVFLRNYRNIRPFEVFTFHEPRYNEGAGTRAISLSSLYGGSGTTGMGIVTTDSANDVWYDLSGRRLQGKPTKSGLYINNGKKVVVGN